MSLDIWLTTEKTKEVCRSCGGTGFVDTYGIQGDFNTTHNHNRLADALGVYTLLWNKDGKTDVKAAELIEPLEKACEELKRNMKDYRQYDAPNGWGKCEDFLRFMEDVLNCCRTYPETLVNFSV